MSKFSGTLLAVLAISSASVVAQKPLATVALGAAPPVTVHAQVSRTAAWLGDPITYTVEVTCPPGTDILPEDLGRDRLRVQGLDLSGATLSRQTYADGTTIHRAVFSLASFSVDETSLRIEPIRVRYYVREAGQRLENLSPAGEVEVPPTEIALRSTLPNTEPAGIRDARAPLLLPAFVRFLRPVGLTAIALSFAPVLLGLVAFAARRLKTRGKRRSRRHPRENRAALKEIRKLDGTTSAARVEAFTRLDALVREYLTDLDIPAWSLTADEIRHRVTDRLPQASADMVASVLLECHKALYGGAGQLPDAAALDRALDQTGEVLASRVR